MYNRCMIICVKICEICTNCSCVLLLCDGQLYVWCGQCGSCICNIGYYDILFLVWLYVVFKTMCNCFKYEMFIELLIGIIINKELLLISNWLDVLSFQHFFNRVFNMMLKILNVKNFVIFANRTICSSTVSTVTENRECSNAIIVKLIISYCYYHIDIIIMQLSKL